MAAGVVVGGVLIGLLWSIGGRIERAVGGRRDRRRGRRSHARVAAAAAERPRRRTLGRAGVSVVVLTARAGGRSRLVGRRQRSDRAVVRSRHHPRRSHATAGGTDVRRRAGRPVHASTSAASSTSHGVKGTFFEVGKAVDARPEISRALRDDGQLVGNHSYHHDYWRWLDPRYPELDRTQQAFQRHSASARRSSGRPTASERRSCSRRCTATACMP